MLHVRGVIGIAARHSVSFEPRCVKSAYPLLACESACMPSSTVGRPASQSVDQSISLSCVRACVRACVGRSVGRSVDLYVFEYVYYFVCLCGSVCVSLSLALRICACCSSRSHFWPAVVAGRSTGSHRVSAKRFQDIVQSARNRGMAHASAFPREWAAERTFRRIRDGS